ncbi:MAG: WXG100 family type VII secretion target [Pseudonocardiaceae bacterium]|nr:WXG100 family type VII secretion target [Pseudonocardiaceae bacterium]
MAGQYEVTPEEMQAGAKQVFQVNEEVQGELSKLRNQLAPLAGAWKGSASVSFQNLMQRWDQNAQTLNEALRGIAEQLEGSGTAYQAEEEVQQQSMSRITSELG